METHVAQNDGPLKMPPLTENEIRPDSLMSAQMERYEADLARLMQHREEFVFVSCPACDSDESSPEFEKMGIAYVTCAACQTLYTNPRPKREHLQAYYENSENYRYWAEHIFPASEDARRERIFRPRAERIGDLCERFNVDLDVLVEVGPGFGTFCEEMAKIGSFRDIYAIEPTPELAEVCRERGIQVIQSQVEDVDVSALPPVNVIASFEAIEHLFEPIRFVEACNELLSPGGLLVLSCPNGLGFEVGELRASSGTVDAEHLNYFNPDSLSILVSRAGLDPIEVTTPGRLDAELVRKQGLDGRWDPSKSAFLQTVLIDKWDELGESFQDFLVNAKLSSHMWLVARKPS